MFKKSLIFSLAVTSQALLAAEAVDLYQTPVSSLKQFQLEQTPKSAPASPKQARSLAFPAARNSAPVANSLQQVSQTQEENETIVRYQQLYKGIPVVGAQIMITKSTNQGINASKDALANGHLLNDIQIDINPSFKAQQAIELAKKSYFSANPQAEIQEEASELQIRPADDKQLKLVYLVSFKTVQGDSKPAWPFFVIDAQTGTVIQQWNNIKNYLDHGPGGNEKVHQYWYGKDGLPSLEVTQSGSQCVMDNPKVKLVNVGSAWDWNNSRLSPHQYPCNNNVAENTNGAFSPANDAYYFGHTIVDMYKDWYGLNALQLANGSPMKLVMRVHFGQNYDNAFWDGQSMSFGDGQDFYPLVSLDIAGHEVTHGFTEQHSGLEYHDQPGALNESMSDMAGQASRSYLLEKTPLLYSKAYLQPNVVTWGIGETIVRDSVGKALRFMDYPSSDGSSADCLDKQLAQSNGAYCAISYDEIVAFAKANIMSPQDQQSFIVHTASGVFNKAFYLLSQSIGIKTAYHVMIVANTKYWTPSTDFKAGACGVIYAAKDLAVDTGLVKNIFGQVGVETSQCSV
ncbi:M4 family metallopeptidase [Legionella fallonii]|uniref:Neutral metalloproteinase n=1 Tax=Legionella fallonii LLAP-10 TaxID=1212491 RepID=A0A098G1Z3_9GAMM|nr:M4 family metallopeptidase [Legionella fallonii]CEG55510.1 Hemagglutinin [Legionella fallonii LLAP-10]